MQLSAEVRLFWAGREPEALRSWFLGASVHTYAAGGGQERTDVYLADANQLELGIKQRGGKSGVEIKGLVALLPESASVGSYSIPIELWSKWSSQTWTFDQGSSIMLRKRRWLRKFDTSESGPIEIPLDLAERPLDGRPLPEIGCNVEWTALDTQNGESYWTLGFESFGSLRDVEESLRSVIIVMNKRLLPTSIGGWAGSYPIWISKSLAERSIT
jgi:hypothetical protein